jgi:ubiquinol-cytochrome c reductase cytochrome c subunit
MDDAGGDVGAESRRARRAPRAHLFAWTLVPAVIGLVMLGPTARARGAQPVPDAHGVFLADCAVCHGSDARGTARGPSLIGVGRASIDYELSTGRMPLTEVGRANDEPGAPLQPLPDKFLGDPDKTPNHHRAAYPPATLAALEDYVVGLTGAGGPDIPRLTGGNLAEGGALFRLECAACHAWAGDGGALVDREAPGLHEATDTQIAEAIRVGPGQMPAFGAAALTDNQVASVVAYVRYLDKPRDRGGDPLWHLGPFAEGGVALAAVGALLLFVRWIGERG